MTDEEKQEYIDAFAIQTKKYCRIDYEDDDDIVKTMIEATFEKMQELLPNFNPYAMTSRQKILVMAFVKDHYDNPDAYRESGRLLSNAFSSMLLSEMYGGSS